mgnify:CR=1 FL=1
MELYVTVSFWLCVAGLTINLFSLMAGDFPKVRKETVGQKTAQVLIGCAFAVWAGRLLYA